LQEMITTMLNESNVKDYFCAEAINTSYYISNSFNKKKFLIKTYIYCKTP